MTPHEWKAGQAVTISAFNAAQLDACARDLAALLGREWLHSGAPEAVEVIACAARDLATCRHVQAAVTAASVGCDVEGILRAAGVIGADGKPTPKWRAPRCAF